MSVSFDLLATTGIAAIVVLIGNAIVKRVKIFRDWAIPGPIVSGLIIAIILSILNHFNIFEATWDKTLSDFLMNVFFTCLGFGFSIKNLKKGSKYILPIFITVGLVVLIQGFGGIIISEAFDINPLIGINATTGAHAGGPGTSAAFGVVYEELGAIGAAEAGLASATVGLALGSVTGGPVSSLLARRKNLRGEEISEEELETSNDTQIKNDMNSKHFFQMVCMILIVGMLGIPIQYLLGQIPIIEMPYFIGMIFSGAIMRNVIEAMGIEIYEPEISTIESTSLNIFLATTIMTLDFTQIIGIIGPIGLMVIWDLVLTLLFSYFVVFKMYGSGYDAVVMVAGFIGTMMGSGTNAVANQRSVMDNYGYSEVAWVIFPSLSVIAVNIWNPLFMSLAQVFFV